MDLISDAFSIIRNAYKAKKEETIIRYSKSLLNICELLKKEGYLENYKEIDFGDSFKKRAKIIKLYLKYDKRKPALTGIKRVSKQSQRIFVNYKNIPSVLSGYGIAIISTSRGILTDKEAREKKVGGELIGIVW